MKYRKSSEYQQMRSIPELNSQESVLSVLTDLKKSTNKQVQAWARHKSYSWIISGYNMHFSKINADTWKSLKRYTNVAEALNAATNATGKQLSLLDAWKR